MSSTPIAQVTPAPSSRKIRAPAGSTTFASEADTQSTIVAAPTGTVGPPALLHCHRSLTLICVTVHHSRIAVLATVLAFLAVLGMSALGGWHAAIFHDDAPGLTMVVEHIHIADVMDDHDDNVVHIAAHAVGHAFEIPAYTTSSIQLVKIALAWPTLEIIDRAGIGPTSLRRPPRA